MEGQLTMPRILWAALFASTLIYLVVLELVTLEADEAWEMLLYPLAFVAAMSAAASIAAPRMIRNRASGGARQGLYMTALILSMALAESLAVFGLVLGLLGGTAIAVLPFFVASWILMLIQFPTQEKLDRFNA
ncbi:MAG: hypothetical protein ACN4G0_02485 [Polyangiales bacterium]